MMSFKYSYLFLTLLTIACSQRTKIFNASLLSEKQKQAALDFKSKKDLYNNWNIIVSALPYSKEEPFGKPNIRMTKSDAINFIGKPDLITKEYEVESLNYELGVYKGESRTAFLLVNEGLVIWFGYTSGSSL